MGLAVVFLVLVGLFLLFRAFWLWYWKLDRIAADIETANELLAQIRDLLRARERER